MAANILYDKHRASGATQPELELLLKPLHDKLKAEIAEVIEKDLPSAVIALKSIDHECKALEEDARFLIQKKVDAEAYTILIEELMKDYLKKRGVPAAMQAGFSITLTEHDGKEILVIR